VENLDAWYGQAQALRGVSLTVQPGEIVGVLGRNGVGKSTLLKSVSRIHRRARGRLELFGEDILDLAPEQAASKGIGMVREGAIVFDTFTVQDHLELAATLAQRRNTTAELEEVADWFPVLWARRSERGGYLSGGQRQMLCLAMAFLAQPTCLLLDEPSAGLAESVVESVYESVRRIAVEKRVALLVAEQDGRWLEGLASRAYLLDNGANVEERSGDRLGEPDEDWLAKA
jgi:branched-chain amino acid transport system ATP-binding protein